MRIAVLSGKGGTGKTLVSVNLAAAAPHATYADCDVEEPNGHLYFKPDNIRIETVYRKLPRVDPALCSGCRACVDFCRFHALAFAGGQVHIFDEVCHSCGGCELICEPKALKEEAVPVGEIQQGVSESVTVYSGIMNPGEASGIPIIKKLLKNSRANEDTFIDCPPGSACTVMESIHDADFCVLVAEPTLFGVHNLRMVYELVKIFSKPCGVVLNKCLVGEGENPSEKFCQEEGIKILAGIPFDNELGTLHSEALIAVRERPGYQTVFADLLKAIRKEVSHGAASDLKR